VLPVLRESLAHKELLAVMDPLVLLVLLVPLDHKGQRGTTELLGQQVPG